MSSSANLQLSGTSIIPVFACITFIITNPGLHSLYFDLYSFPAIFKVFFPLFFNALLRISNNTS